MKRKMSTRRLVAVLMALIAVAVGVSVVLVLASGKLSYTDDAVDIELVPPTTSTN